MVAESFESFFARRMRPAGSADAADTEAIRIAACALLLEIAHADDEFTTAERSHIEAIMRRHFALDEDTAREVMALAQEARSEAGAVPRFARLIRAEYELGQKMLLAEIMWGLVLVDGGIARHEAHLLHRISSLLELEAGYLDRVRAAPPPRWMN
jgi:uncharacterized tellurite resistance protein B-like protein